MPKFLAPLIGGMDATLATATVTTLTLTNPITQAKSHASPDTDSATSALHHTLGTGANQAAAGNDSRLSDARTPSNDASLVHINNTETITGAKTFSNTPVFSAGGSLQLYDAASGTAPSKWIRINSNLFQIINNAYSVAILNLTDAGNLTVTGSVAGTTGNFSGLLTASASAVVTGSLTVSTTLGVTGVTTSSALRIGTSAQAPADGQLRLGSTTPMIYFDRSGTAEWLFYDTGAILYVRDTVNSRMQVSYVAGTTDALASTTFGSAVAVNGLLNAYASAAITGYLTVSTSLGVTGATTLAGMTATTGSFSSTLGVTGTSTLGVVNSGALSVTGAATVSTTLGVTGNTTLSGGTVTLNAAGSNKINWGQNGVAGPAFTTRSVGTKLVLFDALTGASGDYGFGIDSSTLWASVDTTAGQFKWYGGTTLAATLTGLGAMTLAAGLTATTGTFSGAVSASQFTGNATGLTGSPNITTGTITSGTINGQTISSAANFTNTVTAPYLFVTSGNPISFRNIGSGTYNQSIIYHDTTNGLFFDVARTTDAGGGTPLPFQISTRGNSAATFSFLPTTGALSITGTASITGTVATGALTVTGALSSTTTITAGTGLTVTTGNIGALNGYVYAASNVASTGNSVLGPGDTTHSGLISFYGANGNRSGYIGYAGNAAADSATINYWGGAHTFGSGAVNATGGLTVTGTATATTFTGAGTGLTGTAASLNIGGNAATLTNFVTAGSGAPIAADAVTYNGVNYVSSNIALFGQVDGALYSQAYSSSWIHELFGDYRTGQLGIRGKNSGAWSSWRTVLDSTNYTSYAPTLTGTGASGSWGISITGTAALASGLTGSPNITTGTITSGLINGQTISSAANFTGTVAITGALTAASLVLTTDLAVAEGGTGGHATPTAGGIAYGDGTALAYLAAALSLSSPQFLQSNAGSAPNWNSISSSLLTDSLNVLRSGTTLPSNGSIPYVSGGGTNSLSFTAAGSTNQVLVSQGASAPVWKPNFPQIQAGSSVVTLNSVGNQAISYGVTFSPAPTVLLMNGDSANGPTEVFSIFGTPGTAAFNVHSSAAVAATRRINWIAIGYIP